MRSRFIQIIVCLLVVVVSSCQKQSAPQQKQIIRTCLATDINSFDPRKGVDMATQGVLRMLFAGLAYLDQNLEPKLDLASSYRVSDDFKTYIFFLRDCQWSDGTPITAQDFEETWKTALTPAYSSLNTNLFYFIKNAKKAFMGTVSIDQVGIRCLDDKTLVIELEKPNPHFLKILINSVFSPVHSSMRYNKPDLKHFVSSGPFALKQYKPHDQIVLKKNSHYWDADQIRLDELDYFIIKDQGTALLMFEKGEVDWLGEPLIKIPADSIPDLRARGLLHASEGAGTHWLLFNTKRYPYNNANIRKALSYSIDRQKILTDILHDNATPPLGLIPKILKKERWHPWFRDSDTKLAREYFEKGLKELGIPASDFPLITLNYAINATWSKVNQAIQQMWSETLGIKVKLEASESAVFLRAFTSQDFDIARLGWILQYDDAANLLDVFKYKNTQPNYTGWENPEFIRESEAIYYCSEQEKWNHIEAAEKIFFDEMPSVPVMDMTAFYVRQPYVKGVLVNHLYLIDFRWASIEEAPQH